MGERFTYKNGTIYDDSSMDNPSSYNLNDDEGRLNLLEFMNDREKMIDGLNDEIERHIESIHNHNTELRNMATLLRRQERISDGYKEMADILMRIIGDMNDEL